MLKEGMQPQPCRTDRFLGGTGLERQRELEAELAKEQHKNRLLETMLNNQCSSLRSLEKIHAKHLHVINKAVTGCIRALVQCAYATLTYQELYDILEPLDYEHTAFCQAAGVLLGADFSGCFSLETVQGMRALRAMLKKCAPQAEDGERLWRLAVAQIVQRLYAREDEPQEEDEPGIRKLIQVVERLSAACMGQTQREEEKAEGPAGTGI